MSWVGKVDNTASVSVGWPLSKIQNPPRYRFTDEYGSEWLETVAMTPQGIQPHSEEKEIVCWEWFSDTVDGWSPDTILLVLPNGMVETVGSIPSSISKHKQIRLWWNIFYKKL